MRQIALPLTPAGSGAPRIVVGNANANAIEALADPSHWPFNTAVLSGPPRSGKSLLARWFSQSGAGEALDGVEQRTEADVFHQWNRAQESGRPLLLVTNSGSDGWKVTLPDLASRVGSALHLQIGTPDEAMLGELIVLHGEMRGMILDDAATAYLVPRCERSHVGVERLVEAIDRLSLERKTAPTLSIWRAALDESRGGARAGT